MKKGKLIAQSEIPSYNDDAPTRVTIHKIDNGFVIESYSCGKEQAEFIKNISKAPTVIKRLFNLKYEDREMMSRNTEVEETEKDSDGKVDLKVKITR